MNSFRRIFAFGSLAVLVTMSFTGCPNSESPVDTSQRILVESGQALSSVDAVLARNITAASDESIEHVRAEVEAIRLENPGSPVDPMALYSERMEDWRQLTAALEGVAGLMLTWESANDEWREQGGRPPDWEDVICIPLQELSATVTSLLRDLDVEVPTLWQNVVSAAPTVCTLGIIAADMASSEEEPSDE